jgi:hypothetical protein
MQRVLKWLAVGTALALLATVALREASPTAAKKRFIAKWEHLLREVQSPEELLKKLSADERALVLVKKFEDGTWVIARGESVPAGDRFDATLLRASSGRTVLTGYRFSGFEGLSEYFRRVLATTAAEYMSQFTQQYDALDVTSGENR